jgi:2-deoxy-D-gluconate 3-dehydrogenase
MQPVIHETILSKTLAHYGRVDILVNNAGIIRRADLTDFTEQDWDDVMQVNLKALFMLSQAAAKRMIAQKSGGKIINIASLLSFQGGIRVPSYAASKSGVRGLTMELANELARYNIQVNAIAPGYMVTNNTELLRGDPVRSKQILERIPAGRWGTPSDLAGACVFLASAASDYVTGVTLPVDGGWLGR